MSLALTALGSISVFLVVQRELENRQIAFLGDYVRERSSNVDKRFSNLEAAHKAAARELERRVRHLTPAQVNELTARYYPLNGDGTRRSRPEAFDGQQDEDGGYTYGMGAFIGRADLAPPAEMAALVAAYDVVADFGQAIRGDYDNFYFFTPSTRLVMFGPDRPDHLMFYRHDAPADLDVSGEEMARITLPANDPSRATRCTNLQRLIQNNHGERLATGCITPAYVDGRYVGSFGSSIELTGFFLSAVRTTLPGASSLVITDKGELIASPGLKTPGAASPETIAEYERRLGLKSLIKAIKADGRTQGVIASADGRSIVAFGKLSGPNWYLLLTYPKAAVAWSAAKSASWLLLVGVLATILQTLLILGIARRSIVDPLERLAASCTPGAVDRTRVGRVERRRDEIGVLARALRDERQKVDTVMTSLEERVHSRTAELERANAEKSRFLANMSHELRTPLNGVIAISESLAQQQDTKRGRELADLIVSSGRLLEQVLTDILDFSKIEAGEITLANEAFSLGDTVSRIAELHRAAAESKGLALAWEVGPDVAGRWTGDNVRLTQVLSNLLSNAVKFTEAGRVSLTVRQSSGGVTFEVSDTGIGFDDEVKARLFRRFEQADDSIRRRFGGTGLGLAISRSLVELMGGAIEVTSVPGAGSTFAFTLPLARAEAVETPNAPSEEDGFSLEGARVLLAEDHPTNQRVIQLIVESAGLDLDIVENGALALERLAAQSYDVVLMDMQMPELDGLSATQMLRRREAETGAPRTPVIMLTANALDEHVRASRAAGADEHLPKPIRAASLFEAMVRVMSEAPSVEQPEAAGAA
jgi:signal transduction histidine kinase/ActR/RegA family two-component response regulator